MQMRDLSVLFVSGMLALFTPAYAADMPTSASSTASSAASPAGEVVLLTGRGTATNPQNGAIRALAKGDSVYSGDILNAGSNSYINIKFSDGAFILLRPGTRFAIEQYAYAPASTPPAAAAATVERPKAAAAPAPTATRVAAAGEQTVERAFLRLIKGGFRTISGLIGKTNASDYQVNTPVATIGIRGTDYYSYICDLACATDPVISASLMLLHADPSLAEGATLSGVIHGSISVTNRAGQTEVVSADQFLLTLTDGRQIRLPAEPRFLRVSPFPNPATMCAD